MSHHHNDLHSLYRQAVREARPTRADRRAVRAAILSAGIASSALHAATASGKLISLVPGGAKVLTLGQVVTYACLGVGIGGGLAAVGAATVAREPTATVVNSRTTPVRHAPGTVAVSAPARAPADDAPKSASEPGSPALPRAPNKPTVTTQSDHQVLGPSRSQAQMVTTASPVSSAPGAPAVSNTPQPPSLVAESRELGAVQAALGTNDAARALQLLDAQDRAFSGGTLTQERAAARVLALCISGRSAEAQLAKQTFLSAYPGSPWLRRINAACAKY